MWPELLRGFLLVMFNDKRVSHRRMPLFFHDLITGFSEVSCWRSNITWFLRNLTRMTRKLIFLILWLEHKSLSSFRIRIRMSWNGLLILLSYLDLLHYWRGGSSIFNKVSLFFNIARKPKINHSKVYNRIWYSFYNLIRM